MKTTPQSRIKSIIQLVVLYAVMSGAWIFLSDILLTAFFSANVEQFKEYSILKGLFFVGTTSGMFYFFCMKWQRHLERVETNLELNTMEVVTGKTKYARIFEVANEALFIIDRDTLKFLEVNESACVMYGYSKNDFLHTLSVLDISINRESSIKSINSETIRVEYALHKKSNGEVFPVDISLTYFSTDDQRLIAASVRNMSTHYELVNSLKSNEQKYIDAQLMGNVGNWTWDLGTQSVIWSPGLFKIYGITPTELPKTEEDFYAFIHPDDRELVSKQLELLFKYKQPVKWDSRFVLKDNQVRYVMNQCIIKVDKSGEPIEVVGTIADITDRKIAEIEILKMNQLLEERVAQRTKELVVLNQDKDEILSITAHDLRNPLGGILLQSSLVKLYYEKGQLEQANTYILDIEKSVHRMNEIITNLLNSHALEIGKYNFEFNEYDCSEVVRITVDTFESQANHKGIHITSNYTTPSIAYIDKDAFREVLENLLSNAVKYSPLNKNITVNLSFTSAGKLRVEVQDEGPGISVEDQKRLFGKFVRLSAKPTGGESSSGLGLSIAKSIVEQMHGSIWCESIEGVGSTFFVEFPVHSPISQ